MLHTGFTRIERDRFGTPTFALDRVGRASLGIFAWRLLFDLQHPMNGPLRAAWAAFVRSNPGGAIRAYAQSRGDDDLNVDEVLATLKRAHVLSDDGEN